MPLFLVFLGRRVAAGNNLRKKIFLWRFKLRDCPFKKNSRTEKKSHCPKGKKKKNYK